MTAEPLNRKPIKEADETPSGLLERTLRILELLIENAIGMQLFDIAKRLGIPCSATHRVLVNVVTRFSIELVPLSLSLSAA